MSIRPVAIPVIGPTIVSADPPPASAFFYPGSHIPETDSWRVLEYTKFASAWSARDRAAEIINAGFNPGETEEKE